MNMFINSCSSAEMPFKLLFTKDSSTRNMPRPRALSTTLFTLPPRSLNTKCNVASSPML